METPPWAPSRNDSLPPTLTPAVPPYVKLGLTVVYTVFYALLFVFIYVQLWLVLRYRHKRLSYQSTSWRPIRSAPSSSGCSTASPCACSSSPSR
ncbi:hypothetical protein P7K49_035433 [Saguinus oedipus]|uniref:Uncharacterized protein n=1 Tax=Saguinus oedipus TaxID=9490 RepID=A0ABQ9TMQ1_SAGOE|nr:hypothetical protein P7K49_035433 [Saguinus oedipus]